MYLSPLHIFHYTKGSRATTPLHSCGLQVCLILHHIWISIPTATYSFTQSVGTKSSLKCPSFLQWVDETQMLNGFCGTGSGLCPADHQLSWAVLIHFACQHSRRFLPCNQKRGRDSLFCQLSMKSSSGVGGNTNQWPWLLMTPGCSKDLKSISKAPVHKTISLWQLLFAPLEQWLHISLPGGWKWADVAGSCAGEG